MVSLADAASLVPAREHEESLQPLMDSIASMDLSELLNILVLPKDEESYASNLSGIVKHFQKKSAPPLKEITAGVVETFRELKELDEDADAHGDEGLHILKRIAKWGFKRIVKY